MTQSHHIRQFHARCLADDTANPLADTDVLDLGSGTYSRLTFGGDWETVSGDWSAVDYGYDAISDSQPDPRVPAWGRYTWSRLAIEEIAS